MSLNDNKLYQTFAYQDPVRMGAVIRRSHKNPNNVRIKKPESKSLSKTEREALYTLNGMFHRTIVDEGEIELVDAYKNYLKTNENFVGCFYSELAESIHEPNVSLHPIQLDDLYKLDTNQSYYQNLCVDVSEHMNSEYDVFSIVIGGYMHFAGDGIVEEIGDYKYQINFNMFSWPHHFFEMLKFLDITDITDQLETNPNYDNSFKVSELLSDTTFERLMTLPFSFFCVWNKQTNGGVKINRVPLEYSGIPDYFMTFLSPNKPLVTDTGRMLEYWARREGDRYLLATPSSVQPNYVFATTDWHNLEYIDDSKLPYKPFFFPNAHFVETKMPAWWEQLEPTAIFEPMSDLHYNWFERDSKVRFRCKVTFPNKLKKGVLWEQGGRGSGSALFISDKDEVFRLRAFDGDASIETGGVANIDIPFSDLPKDNQEHTVMWEIDPINGSISLWIDYNVVDHHTLGRNRSIWAGSDTGSYGFSASSFPGEQPDENTAPWPGTLKSDLYYYEL